MVMCNCNRLVMITLSSNCNRNCNWEVSTHVIGNGNCPLV